MSVEIEGHSLLSFFLDIGALEGGLRFELQRFLDDPRILATVEFLCHWISSDSGV